MRTHRTYRDAYCPISGHLPNRYRDLSYSQRPVIAENIFEEVLEEAVGQKIDEAIAKRSHVTTKVQRTVTFLSDADLECLEDKNYERVSN